MAWAEPFRSRPRRRLLPCALVLLVGWQIPAFVPAPARTPSAASSEAPHGLEVMVATTAAALLSPTDAWAKGGQWGPLEGKASSLVHPFVMASLFLVTLYTGFLGWQWRSTRLIMGDISALKKQMPKEAEPESPEVLKLQKKIDALSEERKELVDGKYKDRHYQISSLLLAGGVFFTVYGVFNTWFRAEKLFPGPHLFAGAGVCVLWCLAAACVPFMEKGNEVARNLHIAFNVLCFLLFAWQLPTGFEIFLKVLGLEIPWF